MQAMKITDFKSIRSDDLSPSVNIDILNKFIIDTKNAFPADYDIKVLTFIGLCATGKSTTLNALSALLRSQNNTDFVNANQFDRAKRTIDPINGGLMACTIGLYCRIIPRDDVKKVFILIDTQGTGLTDTVEDPLVILFSYCISDILMVNTRGFSTETFSILEDITLCSQYFNEVSKTNKPTMLFRLYDATTNNSAELQSLFNTIMQDKMDNVKMTREYTKTFFNMSNIRFVWSGRPSEENIKQVDSPKPDIGKFISETVNYHKMCQTIVSLLVGLPIRRRDFHKELIQTSKYINMVSSKIRSTDRVIYKNLSDELLKKWLKTALSSSYQNIFTHSRIMDCSDPTVNLILHRKMEIDEFKREICARFNNSPDISTLMNNISQSIDDIYNQMAETFNHHKQLVLKNIYSTIRTELSAYDINISKDEWMNKDNFDTFVNRLTLGLSKDIGEIVRKYANERYYMIAEKFNHKKDQFNSCIKTVLFGIKSQLIEKKNKCSDDLKIQANDIHFTYDEIITLNLYRIQKEYNIILDLDIINNADNLIVKHEIKEEKIVRFDSVNSIYTKIPRFKIIYDENNVINDLIELNSPSDAIFSDYIDISKYGNDVTKAFNDLKLQYERFKTKFLEIRRKCIPQLLEEINTKSVEEVIEQYELIKHNDLYIIAIEPKDPSSPSYKLFMSDKSLSYIMTADQFVKKFGKIIFKIIKKYLTTDNELEKDYIRFRIYDMIGDHLILEDN